MKKISFIVAFFLFLLCFSTTSHASLTTLADPTGDKVAYDDATGNYWYWDLSAMTGQTYAQNQVFISGFNVTGSEYYGLENWHMATLDEMNGLWTYNTNDLKSNFNQSSNTPGWYGRFDELDAADTHYYTGIFIDTKYSLTQFPLPDGTTSDGIGAWITTTAVPIPGAVWLLGAGFVCLAGMRNKFKPR